MTILVTGATGTVGIRVTELLARRGARVRAFTRNAERARRLLPESLQIAEAIGKEIPFVELSEEEAREQWRKQGYDEESIEFFVRIAQDPPQAGIAVLPTVEQVLGRPARTFAEWAEEHKQRFL